MIHSIEDFLAIAQTHGLRLDPERVELNDSGLDFLVAFATNEDGIPWVLRAPRRPDVFEVAAEESRVLALVRNRLPVAVPDWRVNTPELIAYPRLNGVPLAVVDPIAKNYVWQIDPQTLPDTFVDSLADALVALHGVDQAEAAATGVRVLGPTEVRRSVLELMETARREFGVSDPLWHRWRTWLDDETSWPAHSALVHGDLHAAHILVDPDSHKVTGLLDWTEAEVADPGSDFGAYYTIFGEAECNRLLDRYEAAGGRVWPRMHEHIVEWLGASPLTLARFALRSGEATWIEVARSALGVSDPLRTRG